MWQFWKSDSPLSPGYLVAAAACLFTDHVLSLCSRESQNFARSFTDSKNT